MKRVFRTLLPLLLTAALIWGSVGGTAATDGAVQPDKEEVIYALLAPDGAVRSVYAVNAFNVTEKCVVEDYGSYTEVTNLTSDEALTLDSGRVTAPAESGRFYYQGLLTGARLPWTVKIAYELDGERISAEELAGKTGALKLTVTVTRDALAEQEYIENYLLQTTVTLDTARAKSIAAEGATVANAGGSKALSFSLMPDSDAEYVITADVNDFEMAAITLNAVPMSFDFTFDANEFTGELSELEDAIAKLNTGAKELSDGADDMADGAAKLAKGSRSFRSGLNSLSKGSEAIVSGSEGINGALTALSSALSAMTAEDSSIASLALLPNGLDTVAGGLRATADTMDELSESYDGGLTAMNNAVGALPAPQDFSALAASADPQVLALLNAYGELAAASGAVKGTWNGYAQLFGSIPTALEAYADTLRDMAAGLASTADAIEAGDITGGLGELAENIASLATQYSAFHTGLSEYTGGVDKAASGYGSVNRGIASLSEGVTEYADGAGEYADGMNELRDGTANMDERIDEELQKLLAEFDRSDYVPKSFMSPMNMSVTAVQFVIKAEGVTKPADTEAEAEEPAAESLLDRIAALFGR